jgi:hypothetical protein
VKVKLQMSEHIYNRYNKSNFIIVGSKEKYANISKQLGGKWNKKEDGWIIPDKDEIVFKQLMNVLYPDNNVEFPNDVKQPPEVVDEEVVKQKTIPEPVVSKKKGSRRKFVRARSVGSSSDNDSVVEDIPEVVPNQPVDETDYNAELYDDEEFNLTSSGSDNDSSSSEDFPTPSPKRKQLANDDVLDKMERVRRRMFEMDMEEKRKKKKD